MVRFLFFSALFFFNLIIFGQKKANYDLPKTNIQLFELPMQDSLPEWVSMMLSESPNFYVVENNYNDYYTTHPFVKNSYTRHYKQWKKQLLENHYVQADGSILIPSDRELEENVNQWNRECVALASKSSNRSTHTWEFIGPHLNRYENLSTTRSATSCMSRLAIFKPNKNIMYATSENGVISKSTDHGENWAPIGFNGIFEIGIGTFDEQILEVHPTNSNILYYGVKNKLWRSTDGGNTWSVILNVTDLKPTKLLIHPSNPDTLYLSSYVGVYRSTDNGATFTQVRTGRAWDIQFKTNNATTLFGIFRNGTKSEFYKSTDSGITWTLSNTGWFPFAQDFDNGGRMAVSVGNPNLIWCLILGKVTGGPSTNLIVGVAKSTDAGATWTTPITYNNNKGISSDYNFRVCAIGVSQTNDNRVMVGNFQAHRTEDGFNTVITLPWDNYQHEDIQQCQFIDDNNMWVLSDGGIDKYSADLSSRVTKSNKLFSDIWAFDQGWNEDVRAITLYHNGVGAFVPTYPDNQFRALTTGEPTFAYVNVGNPKKVLFTPYPDGKYLQDDITSTNIPSFTYGVEPNTGVGEYTNSTIRTHPQYNNIQFLGFQNKLYKTVNNGVSFEVVNTFGTNINSKICAIEISRSDSNFMLVHQLIRNASNDGWTSGILWKTADAGATWSEIPQPASAPLTDGLYVQIDPLNKDNIWIGYNKTSSLNKIFKSINGGATWSNLTTTTLNDKLPMAILHIGGTDGGIVLVTRYAIFYRNNNMADWDLYGNNLPGDMFARYVRPFYKEGKIRLATSHRGLWSVDLYEAPTTNVAQAMVNMKETECQKDTFRFDDYSMINHNTASWSWSFPGASYVSATNVRNPKVLYPSQGLYSATMTITTPLGTSTSTINVEVLNSCQIQPFPTKAASFSGISTSNVKTISPAPNFGSNQDFTVSYWFKTTSTSSDACMISDKDWDSGSNKGWVFALQSGKVKFNVADGTNRIDIISPAGLNDDQWHHAAVSVTRNGQAILYIDGVQRAAASATDLANIYPGNILAIGTDIKDDYGFEGSIDEIRIWNKALTISEIRENRHLTSNPSEANLIHYYQFNTSGSSEFDFGSIGNHLIFGTNATKPTSTAPVGGGTSYRLNVESGGIKDFLGTGCSITFPSSGTYPDGELCVSRIDTLPNNSPASTTEASKEYWIINNYGSNSTFSPIQELKFADINVTLTSPSNFILHKRISNGHLSTQWINQDAADALTTGLQGSIAFSSGLNLSSFSQFYITRPSCNSIVSAPGDVGSGTLRDALSCIDSGDTITFQIGINTALTDSLLIYKNTVFKGNGTNQTSINMGSSTAKGIVIPTAFNLSLMNMKLVMPNSLGPVIQNGGNLNLDDIIIEGNNLMLNEVLNKVNGNLVVKNNCVIKY